MAEAFVSLKTDLLSWSMKKKKHKHTIYKYNNSETSQQILISAHPGSQERLKETIQQIAGLSPFSNGQ